MSNQEPDLPTSLREWVDAAAAGGFPVPRLPRWQVLRAGVLSLWEFDIAEYWYANGWAQLTGRNESGKSSLMALTTLIPWLADTSSSNIDTLGRSGKKFRYYVEPTGNDGDRRPVEVSVNRGWLWVEYGRVTDDGPRYFTTLLCAETRSAAADVKLNWCTAEGQDRVRATIDLAPQRVVAAPKELDRPGWITHSTATAYREQVATRLLGSTSDRLEAVGRMLRVTRTPKLGAQLEIGFVQQHLRAALPELSRTEIDALANGWDQLDQIRADLATTKAAVSTLQRFRRDGWLPWVRAVVRHRADLASSARTVLDNVTRDEVSARDAVERSTDKRSECETAAEQARQDADSARAAAQELQDSARYADAQGRVASLEQHRKRATALAAQVGRDEGDRDRAAGQEDRDQSDAAEAEATVRRWESSSAERRDCFLDAARRLVQFPAGEFDVAWAGQALIDRRRLIGSALNRANAAGVADETASRSEELAGARRDTAQADAAAAAAAWTTAEQARESLIRVVTSWVAGVRPAVPDDTVDGWLASLPLTVETEGRRDLTGAIRSDWFDPARAVLTAEQERARQRQEHADAEIDRLTGQITDLESAVTPPYPAPVGWLRRARPDTPAAGAPLWALTDPRDDVPERELAGIEAALAAAGLLDAWVSPDGAYVAGRDGDDLVVTTPDSAYGSTLADQLQPSDPGSALGSMVSAMLAGITLIPAGSDPLAIGPSGLALSSDGRWWSPGLLGRAGAMHDHPEWIGESARAQRRRRRIQELADELAHWRTAAAAAVADRLAAGTAIDVLTQALDRSPRDGALRSALTVAAERSSTAERSAAAAAQAETEARTRRVRADELRAELARFCAEHRLPVATTDLQAAQMAVGSAERLLEAYRNDLGRLADAVRQHDKAAQRFTASRERRGEFDARVAATTEQWGRAQATVATLEATINADDREILDELQRLRATETEAAGRHQELTAMLQRLGEALGSARATLIGIERERENAREIRDTTYADFRVLVDRGLGDELGLDFGDAGGTGAERIRSQVAIVRREVVLKDWPTDPGRQMAAVTKVNGDLAKLAGEETRIKLEAGGRTLRIDYDAYGLPVVEVLVDSTGAPLGPGPAAARLREIHNDLAASYSQRVQQTLDELLGSTFLEHLREQLGTTQSLINHINQVLAKHPVVTTKTSLKIVLEPTSPSDAAMLEAVTGPSLADPEVARQVRERLRERVEEAKRLAELEGDEDWRNRLARQLDYRTWFDVALKKRIGTDGRWASLNTQGFAEMSGGARAVILMLPLVATLAALYEDTAGAPRPLWLDEAFDGLDSANREMVMDLFASFDLDVLLAGPARLVNVRTVPAAAIYQVVRAPAPLPGVDLTLELWAGGDLQQVNLPTTLPIGPPAPPPSSEPDTLL